MSLPSTAVRRRIAIIGLGPKGLYGLERLAAGILASGASRCFELHLFEPHSEPGAGPVYDPHQPGYLRLNYATGNVDMWSDDADGHRGPTLVEWLRTHHPAHADPDGYAPRGVVGSYLNAGFRDIVEALRTVATVEIHRAEVVDLAVDGSVMTVRTATDEYRCDEVLIATGHDSRRAAGIPGAVAPVYPIDRPGGIDSIPAGATVAVRGFALTALDVALALTEGRGGTFVPGPTPSRMRYMSGERPVAAIVPFSSTGRPVVPKPAPGRFTPPDGLDEALEIGRSILRTCPGEGRDLARQIRTVVVEVASAALASVPTGSSPTRSMNHELDAFLGRLVAERSHPSRVPTAADVANALRRSVRVAYGEIPPGIEWALGAAWRGLYPALVDLVASHRLRNGYAAFLGIAREMERLAFGPPAPSARRLLALVHAGAVDLSVATAPRLFPERGGFTLRSGGHVVRADVLVDAVLAPAGATPESSPLIASLLRRGLVSTLPVGGGVDVAADGTCLKRDGTRTEGLAMIGRPTEGCVLGNDTLDRSLHDMPARWADGVVHRLLSTVDAAR